MTVTTALKTLMSKPHRLTVIASGAGAGIQFTLWNQIGASNFLTGAHFPYDKNATKDLLGFEPEKSVSRATAIQMASEAYIRSCRGTGTGMPMGLGLTAAVSTNRERRGDNAVDAALITPDGGYFYHLSIEKELRRHQTPENKRFDDGDRADAVAFTLLDYALNGKFEIGIETIPEQELMEVLFRHPVFMPNGRRWALADFDTNSFGCIVPTSGNPPHHGHYGMVEAMEESYGKCAVFSVTADSVHKPSLKAQDLLQRLSYFRSGNVPVILTRSDPLFIDKARQFPGKVFGIGVDALERMLDPKWLTNQIAAPTSIEAMLAEFWNLETLFMVFDRNGKNLFDVWNDVPREYLGLFDRKEKSWDISSSQLRAQATPVQSYGVVTPGGVEDQGVS